jgi:AcrR family transcriptional regulator
LTGRTSSPERPRRSPRAEPETRRTPQRSYAGRTAAERRAERRERLISAGFELFGTAGYAATPIEKLCATAGVSTRSFYEEFDGREALLIALHDRVTKRAIQAVAAALGDDTGHPRAAGQSGADGGQRGVRRRIEIAADAYVRTLASDPRWTRIASVELIGVSRRVEQHRLRWRGLWAELLESEAVRLAGPSGRYRPGDYHLAAMAVIGAVNELMLNWCTAAVEWAPHEITAIIVRFIMGMLQPP